MEYSLVSKRIQFFFGHFVLSILIALTLICVVFLLWYPFPLAKAVGVTHIFLMLIVIDVIIGPMLTFLVYKEGKKTLKMDLSIIVLVQIAVLSYGIYNITEGRPVWIVQNGNRFELVRNNEIVNQNIGNAKTEYQQPSWLKPKFVALEQSKSIEEKNINIFEELSTGISASLRPERYTSLKQEKLRLGQKKIEYV